MDNTYELLQEIKQCPPLYLGKVSLQRLYAFLNGYRYRDQLTQSDCLDGFQNYIQEIYHIHTDHNWASIIEFFSQSDEEAFNKFYDHLDIFLKNTN